MTSLHANFTGYETLFEARAGGETFENDPELKHEFDAECGRCHTTCGQCHVSYPVSVGGGLLDGKSHTFQKSPDMKTNCTACHGSRVGEEYLGTRTGYQADFHYGRFRMDCLACHTGREMHGDGTVHKTRYDTPDMPRCEDCHSDGFGGDEDNAYHRTHGDNIQCQVCHSQDYKNCNACHVGGEGITGSSYITFKIGKNPIPDVRPEYEYVVLRHIPIATDTYEPWGVAELEEYEALPSWKYSSPHNVRRWTARTDTTGGRSCGEACHSTPDVAGWFLRQSDIDTLGTRERDANAPFIVPNGSPVTWD